VATLDCGGWAFPRRRLLFNTTRHVIARRRAVFQSYLSHLLALPFPLPELLTFLEAGMHYQDEAPLLPPSLPLPSAPPSQCGVGPLGVQSVTVRDFDLLRVIGQGSFGRVFLVRRVGVTGEAASRVYAMKVLLNVHTCIYSICSR
jgi:hypothetical protein